ncbi:MAG: SLC13 family permease [Gemmatimonadaceae bacterium]
MTPAELALLAVLAVMIASVVTRLNVGILAVALAWPIAIYGAGWKTDELMRAFPSSLFLTLLGVTLLFGMAQANGTMGALTQRMLALTAGRAGLLPFVFFALACVISTFGPGAIATLALLAPLAMAAGTRAGVPVLLTALMVGNGANAGNLSPFSAVGVIVSSSMEKAGLVGYEWNVWAANFVAHVLAGALAWALFGGPRLLRAEQAAKPEAPTPFTPAHQLTLVVGALWILSVVVFKANLGFAAFAAAAVLVLARSGEEAAMLKEVPWSVLVMVCGVSVLIGVLEGTGGMELFTNLLARIASPTSVNGVIAFTTGTISTYSSTSGVVYPTFLPTVQALVDRIGGGSALEVALSINVGAGLVDVSPLSTLGAMCIAALPAGHEPAKLFRSLLLWGFSMTIVGALFCQLFIGLFAR